MKTTKMEVVMDVELEDIKKEDNPILEHQHDNNEESPCHSNTFQIKTEVEDMEVKLEELHHSIDIKEDEDTLILESQSDGRCKPDLPVLDKKPYKCQLCNYKFSRMGNLSCHLSTHTGDKPFKCEICRYKFAQKGHLIRHFKTHTGDKPFKCELCDYKFARKGNLDSHLITHTDKKVFICQICNFKCVLRNSLTMHLKSHMDEKQLMCKICDQKFQNINILNNHLKSHNEHSDLKRVIKFKLLSLFTNHQGPKLPP